MAAFQYENFAESVLASGVTDSGVSLTLNGGDGALFPSSGDYQLVLVRNSDGAREIVKCTSRSTDVLTVTRAQESTTGLVLVTGDKVELRITAEILNSYIALNTNNTYTGTNTYQDIVTMTAKAIDHAVHTEAAHATTSNIWAGGNTCLLSGSAVTFTDVVDAPQAGSVRYVVINAAHTITDGGAIEMDGNRDYLCVAGDVLRWEAKTVSTFRVSIVSYGARHDVGAIVQSVHLQDSALQTLSTAPPDIDDSIPQNTEGDEVMTLAITPTHASNRLVIETATLMCHSSGSLNAFYYNMLFQDSTASAIKTTLSHGLAQGVGVTLYLTHEMAAGTTSATTFKTRIASSTSSTYFNGRSAARLFGGTAGSFMRITEIKV